MAKMAKHLMPRIAGFENLLAAYSKARRYIRALRAVR